MRKEFETSTIINIINTMIENENQRATQYNALNPNSNYDRNHAAMIYKGALTELLNRLSDI